MSDFQNRLEVPEWLEQARTELRVSYNVGAYDFEQHMEQILECGSRTLPTLHDVRELPQEPPLCSRMMHAFKHAGWKMPETWFKAMRRQRKHLAILHKAPVWGEFMEAYHRFIKNEVAPLCGDPAGVVYQCPPTIRIAMPSRAPTIPMHCDSEYDRHQPGEINFWVPITSVWGSNTLHVESAPHRADFHPIEMENGEMLRFNGYHCRHYTEPNETSCTRVSLDFRVIPVSLYHEFENETKKKGCIGDYPSERTGPVQLVQGCS